MLDNVACWLCCSPAGQRWLLFAGYVVAVSQKSKQVRIPAALVAEGFTPATWWLQFNVKQVAALLYNLNSFGSKTLLQTEATFPVAVWWCLMFGSCSTCCSWNISVSVQDTIAVMLQLQIQLLWLLPVILSDSSFQANRCRWLTFGAFRCWCSGYHGNRPAAEWRDVPTDGLQII